MLNHQRYDDEPYSVHLLKGQTPKGTDFFAYIMVRDSYLPILEEKMQSEDLKLDDHCIVLAKGAGHTPPTKVKRFIEQTYVEQDLAETD